MSILKCTTCGNLKQSRVQIRNYKKKDGSVRVYESTIYACRNCDRARQRNNYQVTKAMNDSSMRDKAHAFLSRVNYAKVAIDPSTLIQCKMKIHNKIKQYQKDIRDSTDELFKESRKAKVYSLKIIKKELVELARQL